ncbi:MAG: ABC transporter ATP-binding protein, partial [Bacilli bacterium]|nr:ABC transporter ATP-binding protein [Bacilli bacterium]
DDMGLTMIFIAHDLSTVKYFCNRIAVMYFGNLVELTTSDELFKHPLHPYTKSLLSAIPQPNPLSEKRRVRIVYHPELVHDYSKQKPTLREVVPGHFILANDEELAKYKEEIEGLDSGRLVIRNGVEMTIEEAAKLDGVSVEEYKANN